MYHKLKLERINIEEVFRVAFERNAAPTAIFNLDTTIAMVNDAYCELSGYTREEVVGMSWTQQLPPEELVKLKERNEMRLKDPESVPSKYEFGFYTKKGELKYGLMSVSTLLEDELLVMSFIDITNEKKNELILKAKNEELSRMIAIRDKDLTMTISEFIKLSNKNQKIISLLKRYKKQEHPELAAKIDEIIHEIDQQNKHLNWDKLNNEFNLTYPEFVANLLSQHPNLSPAEIKLCSLLKLNLSTKEISEISLSTPDSIKVARNRLRKKLSIGLKQNLVTYLLAL